MENEKNVGSYKWIMKFYEQSYTDPPKVTKILVFDTEEEAIRAYESARWVNTIYYYWGYPEKIPVNKITSLEPQ